MAKKKGGKARRPQQQAGRQRAAAQSRHQAAKGQGAKGKAAPNRATTSPKAAPTGKGAAGAPAAAAKSGRPVKERSSPTRAERLAAAERARRRRTLRKRAMLAGAVLLVVGVVAAVVVSNRKASDKTISRLEAGGCAFDRRADRDDGAGRNHIPDPKYSVNPPAGGNHLPQAASAGNFGAENTPPDGQIVHAMEHGYIVLWYKPDLPADAFSRLRGDVFAKHDRDVLLVPRPSLPKPVAATAWGARLLCDQVDVAALDLFVTEFVNKGPEKVPH